MWKTPKETPKETPKGGSQKSISIGIIKKTPKGSLNG